MYVFFVPEWKSVCVPRPETRNERGWYPVVAYTLNTIKLIHTGTFYHFKVKPKYWILILYFVYSVTCFTFFKAEITKELFPISPLFLNFFSEMCECFADLVGKKRQSAAQHVCGLPPGLPHFQPWEIQHGVSDLREGAASAHQNCGHWVLCHRERGERHNPRWESRR